MDNNASLNALDSCYGPTNGTLLPKCVQVGYTSNAFIPLCGIDDNHCGTFLEIHMAHGTPYQAEEDIIAEVRIDTRQVSGYYTTVIPTTWMGSHDRVLCKYAESKFRINSLVYIEATAPVCCCPRPYDKALRVGSFDCPIGPTGDGAFARGPQSLADQLLVDVNHLDYPFCTIDLRTNEDRVMCSEVYLGEDVDSVFSDGNRRAYTRLCENVRQTNPAEPRSWGSSDMQYQAYDGKCPYYDNCVLTLDPENPCKVKDKRVSFVGRVGLVTKVQDDLAIPLVDVSFNNGRTSYTFEQRNVKLEFATKSMYEMWWVVRSPTEFTIQKKKSFSVSSPICTFDTDFNRYFPYAKLDENGNTLDSATSP